MFLLVISLLFLLFSLGGSNSCPATKEECIIIEERPSDLTQLIWNAEAAEFLWNTENPDWRPSESETIFIIFNVTTTNLIRELEAGEEEIKIVLEDIRHIRDLVGPYFRDFAENSLIKAWNALEFSIIDIENFMQTILVGWSEKDWEKVKQSWKDKKNVFVTNSNQVKTLLTEINF